MLQQFIVVLAVAAAAVYTAWSLAPRQARHAALSRLDAALGSGVLRERLVRPLLARALPSGGCAGCGSSPASAPAPRRPPSRPS